ncbi:hypothetical protein BASA50_005454 [Batrachochytrium salamandrivorans]|uniref:Phosphorylase kinase alphabeta n=1 Tax=Batrachochytrium salamandrivorans TaxID=1357716 RepID=A0ABQ8FFH0_9FUNG|nr:hypothetical protein BASA50_005454 [Batrachochytrium salamandrivorans]KAH6602663.1 hypothetical protein BASA61_000890 [Batrachochytrium salamandrivorans]KAH9269258.1 hypothetical protein BASA83_008750 [Batrachochytrium salamandrivorans]
MSRQLREAREKLEKYHQEVAALILVRQNPATGLIPASVSISSHGDYRDAWVRDNVYSILAVWGLALAYRRIDDDEGRAYELEHATIKCMRGLLSSMMRQADKVELFKNTQALEHALHAKYNTSNGSTVVGDREWGHLQIDATSIFVLMLAQMTSSGLHIIFTIDEVHFVQNLVFYIERAYRTPDYGIWERGNKTNHGQPELNCSSIGMVVAALQAINGINLFGSRGGPLSVIHVLPDEITRNHTTLHSALPRESASKEVDSALLAVISYPAFAVTDPKLVERTRNEIIKKLGGRYGCKRFLRDGHQTVLENSSRLHYEPHELKVFEGIESEWPLFFTYLILDGLFRGDMEQVEYYRAILDPILVDSSDIPEYSREYHFEHQNDAPRTRGRTVSFSKTLPPENLRLVPELYIVPHESIDAERANPGSQNRVPNANVPLVWAQSLYILGNLIYDGLLSVADIDPLNRRLLSNTPRQDLDTVVQLVFLSETTELQSKLRMYGLETQTLANCEPITISSPSALCDAMQVLGENQKLKLSGRPKRPMGTLSTCKIYRCQGQLYAFLPHFMDREEFYLVSDNDYLVSLFVQELSFVKNHWFSSGRPTMVVMLTNQMLGDVARSSNPEMHTPLEKLDLSRTKQKLLHFMMSLRSSGVCNGVRVRIGRLSEMISTSCIESLDFLVDSENADYEDWEGVLRGHRSLKMDEYALHLGRPAGGSRDNTAGAMWSSGVTDPSTRKHMCMLRKFATSPHSPISGKSALASPLFDNTADFGDFLLQEHREDEPSKLSDVARTIADGHGMPSLPTHASRRPVEPTSSVAGEISQNTTPSISTTVDTVNMPPEGKSTLTADDASASGLPFPGADLLALVLGDDSQLGAASDLLLISANLHDQADLLHYLYSCRGIDYQVRDLCSVAILLEEVYVKAMHMKQWSVVRQTAGLMHKSVNSLTSNLSDLLVRQKPVTVGFGTLEYFIDGPKNPAALAEIIYKHCSNDVREAPLIQEIVTYLGSFIRGSPHLFDGIMRIRTHFFVIAMREEISRVQNCDEEEAVEILMQLSPFEMKSLMDQVLTARDKVNLLSCDYTTSPGVATGGALSRAAHMYSGNTHFGLGGSEAMPSVSKVATPVGKDSGVNGINANDSAGMLEKELESQSEMCIPATFANILKIRAQSGGFQAGNFAKIDMFKDTHENHLPLAMGRGLNVAVFDHLDGSVLHIAHYDTCASTSDSDAFARDIEQLAGGAIVVAVAKDDFVSSLTETAKNACEMLGSTKIRHALYRDSWCLIAQKGGVGVATLNNSSAGDDQDSEHVMPTPVEFHRAAHLGPTETVEMEFNLLANRSLLKAMHLAQDNANVSVGGTTVINSNSSSSSSSSSAVTGGTPLSSNAATIASTSSSTGVMSPRHPISIPSVTIGSSGDVSSSSQSFMPCGGKWLRRRKNDGALNRVPRDFYPKVWKLLDKTLGIAIGRAFLPREPVVSEMTPEELNFALRIEALYDNIRDPAERQIAVELIVVISRIGESHAEMKLLPGRIDILKIVRMAVAKFWDRWIAEFGNDAGATPAHNDANLIKRPPLSVLDQMAYSVASSFDGVAGVIESRPLKLQFPKSDRAELLGLGRRPAQEPTTNSGGVAGSSVNPADIASVETSGSKPDASVPDSHSEKGPLARAKLETGTPLASSSPQLSLYANLEHMHATPTTPSTPSLLFEKNERLARRLFFDLPQNGPDGTLFYLAAVCLETLVDPKLIG